MDYAFSTNSFFFHIYLICINNNMNLTASDNKDRIFGLIIFTKNNVNIPSRKI